MPDKSLKICKNTGICALAGCPVWTTSRRCSLCSRKLKHVQMSDRDYHNLEMRAVEDPADMNPDDKTTKLFPRDYKGHSQSGYNGNPHRGHGPQALSNNNPSYSESYSKPKEDWHVADACVEGCPLEKNKQKPLVRLPYQTYKRWQFLAAKFKTEWLMYLKGTYNAAEDSWTITDEYVPRQRVTVAHVEVAPGQIKPDTIGDVHSHNTMGAFFSAEDKRHFNWPVHIVINARGEVCANVEIELECGRKSRADADVLWFSETGDDIDSRASEINAAITADTTALDRVPNGLRVAAITEPAHPNVTDKDPSTLPN